MTRAVNVASSTMPVGTTAERPASPVAGMQRINTTTGYLEVYNGGSWYNVYGVNTPTTVEYLVVAGGGGGGGAYNIAGSGGSGIVIIRYADTYNAATSTTGSPTITVAGGYRVYTWTASGSITI